MSTILAHAGHGHTSTNSLAHYLLEPEHLCFSLAALFTVMTVLWLSRYRLRHGYARHERASFRRSGVDQ